jgi:hypothetical protein
MTANDMVTLQDEMVTLQVRPALQVPPWWPRSGKAGKAAWVTCDTDGNYVAGLHVPYAMRRWQLARAKTEWLAEHDGRDWQFLVRPCRAKRKRR